MDPTTCYLEMFHAMNDGDYATARVHAEVLQAWLQTGGFYPANYAKIEVDAYLANVLRRTAHLRARDDSQPLPLGQTLITPPAQEAISQADVFEALNRHASGDWGDVDDHDRAENELALLEGLRILSVYHSQSGTKFWVITEADRSATTVLLPGDY